MGCFVAYVYLSPAICEGIEVSHVVMAEGSVEARTYNDRITGTVYG